MNTLISGGIVVTGDKDRTVFSDGAVAVEDRQIVAVGKADDLRDRYPGHALIRAEGKVVMPGLINMHTHTVLTVLRGVAEDVGSSSVYGYMVPMALIMTDEERAAMATLGCLEAIRSGNTTLLETYRFLPGYASAMVQTGLRLVLSESASDADLYKTRGGAYEYSLEVGEPFLARTVDLIERWHGHDDNRVTCQVAAHAPDTCSPEFMHRLLELARRYDVGRTIHLAQSADEVALIKELHGCTSVEYLRRLDWLDSRLVGGHCTFSEGDDVEIFAGNGCHISHNAAINARRGNIAPVPELSDLGANIAMGSDNMSEDMIEVMRVGLMVNRIRRQNRTVPGPDDVLEWATMGGARALHREDELGSIEPGKRADLILVDADKPHLTPMVNPVSCIVHNAHAADVDTVMVDGKLLMRGRKVLTLDESEVIDRAQQVTEDLWRRFQQTYPGTELPPLVM